MDLRKAGGRGQMLGNMVGQVIVNVVDFNSSDLALSRAKS